MITLNESTPQDYGCKHEPRLKDKGEGVAVIYSNIFSITQRSSFKYNSFEVTVLYVTLSSESDKSRLTSVLATVYRPPRHHIDFNKDFADFLMELILAADKISIVDDFNIHVNN